MNLSGKVAIVTGAGGGGHGRMIAQRFAALGASIIVSDIDRKGGADTVGLIASAGGRAEFCAADVSVEADLRNLFAHTQKAFGGLDVLVNNAGPYFPGAPLEHWAETVQANLWGPMFGTLLAIEAMRKRGGGAIVNIGSTSALGYGRKHSDSPAYDATKAGVMHFTATLEWLAKQEAIRVNCLVPDWVASAEVMAYVNSLTDEERKENGVPDELITLDKIAELVVRLATDESLAGRVMVRWCGEQPQWIADGDPGYERLELQ